jgi:glycosyltransferase involved in cell wall biosynthesis
MRVGVFVVMAGRNSGGPETYEHNLVKSLASLDRHNEYHIFCLSRSAADSFQLVQENVTYRILWPQSRWISFSLSLPLALLSSQVDLLHATFTPPPFSPKNYVFTHHCFSTFAHPEFYDPIILRRLNGLIIRGLKKARLILCVSENVRDLTAEKFKISPERLFVVYNGVGENFHPVALDHVHSVLKNTYGIYHPYILYVGELVARKNIIRILEAFNHFRHEVRSDTKLVLAGTRTWPSEGIDETIERLKLKDHVIELGYVNNQDLPVLYSGAEMFVFPSLWEGFGIPVIEAMACSTPVLTSNNSALPEVAGGAAVLIDPYSVEDIASGMYKLFSDATLRQSLRAKGLERAKFFTWRRTAQQTLEAYKRATILQ